MCRFTLYLGPPLRLRTLILEPEHSLILQSYHASERPEPLNGDGFGVGWYAPDVTEVPAVFRSVSPAWSNRNLSSLANVVCSPCIFAHVRAATPGMAVTLDNCHPFQWGRILFMHNGCIGDFRRIRRHLMAELSDEAFELIRGTTDTEHIFALVVDELRKDEDDEDPADRMARCVRRVVTRILTLQARHGDGGAADLNLAISDGEHLVTCRFSTATDRPPETLYYLLREIYRPASADTPRRRPRESSASVVVSSERLTHDPEWKAIAPNQMIAFDQRAKLRTWPLPTSVGSPA